MQTNIQNTRSFDLADILAGTQQQAQTASPTDSAHLLGTPEEGVAACYGAIAASTEYENYSATAAGDSSAYGATWLSQTFTPSVSHTIHSVYLYLRRNGSPGTITVSIRAVDGLGKPTGSDLCSGTTNGDTISNSAFEWRGVSLGAGCALTASTKYAIVIRAASGDGSNYARWDYKDNYASGDAEHSADSGATWTIDAGVDFFFQEWGIAS